ncbi:MAG: FtsW/RodA/SpoVE family cell cycle protein [Paludibacteraceae bacterium]|nr:FtsW/RodA/SpoVE family cell cycle protein [Paludibacteraceae bacterium]MBR1480522.1 FtsW/RodA/SpoVE family cell cycle protein [Paludibacteraceae bacterium]
MKLTRPDTQHIDRTFWVLYALLIIVAVIALFSASSSLVYGRHSVLGPVGSQMLFLLVGVVAAFGIQFLSSRVIRFGGYLLLGFSVLCLYLMLIPHNPFVVSINGAGRWFNLFGLRFQPSEFAKLSLIIVVADQLSRIRSEEDKRKYFYRTLWITLITVAPILPGNLSTTILICGIVYLLWFLARISWKYLVAVVTIAVAALAIGYCIMEFGYIRPHRAMSRNNPLKRAVTWVSRVDDFIEEVQTPAENKQKIVLNDDNYQRSIAKVAIARGGKTPLGVLPGNSQERNYLPLAYADYIFAIIVEETGIIGAVFLCFLYLAVLFRACYVCTRYGDYSAILMVMGLALMLTCQALISMMVAVGIGPVTGQPLPLISRGGTSVVITSIYFGILLCVSREQLMLRDRVNEAITDSRTDVPIVTLE